MAFETVIFQLFPKAERYINTCSLINAAMSMDTDEMSVKAVAEPIAVFGLKNEHLEHFVVVVLPGIVVEVQIQCRFFVQADFCSQIDGFRNIHQYIRFNADYLSI